MFSFRMVFFQRISVFPAESEREAALRVGPIERGKNLLLSLSIHCFLLAIKKELSYISDK